MRIDDLHQQRMGGDGYHCKLIARTHTHQKCKHVRVHSPPTSPQHTNRSCWLLYPGHCSMFRYTIGAVPALGRPRSLLFVLWRRREMCCIMEPDWSFQVNQPQITWQHLSPHGSVFSCWSGLCNPTEYHLPPAHICDHLCVLDLHFLTFDLQSFRASNRQLCHSADEAASASICLLKARLISQMKCGLNLTVKGRVLESKCINLHLWRTKCCIQDEFLFTGDVYSLNSCVKYKVLFKVNVSFWKKTFVQHGSRR